MKRIAFSVTLLLSCVLSASAGQHTQDTAVWQKLRSFVSNVNAFTEYYPQEKVYLHFDNSSYSPFEKIDMEFEARDGRGNPVETNFSLSVRDAGTATLTAYSDNILTNL